MWYPIWKHMPRGVPGAISFLALVAMTLFFWWHALEPRGPGLGLFQVFRIQGAGNAQNAQSIKDAWARAAVLTRARRGQVWDIGFLTLYSIVLGLAAMWAAAGYGACGWKWGRRAAPLIAWLVTAGAAFDLLEDLALLAMLYGDVTEFRARAATVCASCKAVLLAIGIAFIVFGALLRFFDWLRGMRAR